MAAANRTSCLLVHADWYQLLLLFERAAFVGDEAACSGRVIFLNFGLKRCVSGRSPRLLWRVFIHFPAVSSNAAGLHTAPEPTLLYAHPRTSKNGRVCPRPNRRPACRNFFSDNSRPPEMKAIQVSTTSDRDSGSIDMDTRSAWQSRWPVGLCISLCGLPGERHRR